MEPVALPKTRTCLISFWCSDFVRRREFAAVGTVRAQRLRNVGFPFAETAARLEKSVGAEQSQTEA